MLSLCTTQWLVGFGGPYGLNYVAINVVAQALDILIDRTFLEKLKYFEDQALQIIAKKPVPGQSRGCDAAQKEKCKIEFGEHLGWACKNCNN